MVQALVSAVVVNWNRRNLLRNALRSLRNQQNAALEIIVVDNASSDGSVEMIAAEFSEVRVILNRSNRGFCAANNQGIAAAGGEFIALLNNDAEADPQWVAALLDAFTSPRTGMAASKILVYEDPQRIDKAGHLIYPDGQNRGRGTGALDTGQFDRIEPVLWPDGCAAMYRASMLREIGGFDEDLFAYGDDAELGLRARIAGWECLYTPFAVARHHRGSTLGLGSMKRLKLIERNRVLLAAKLFPASLLWLNPWFYFRRLLAGAHASLSGQGETNLFPGWRGKVKLMAALLWGDLEALLLLPRMLRKRGRLAAIRQLAPAEVRQLILSHRIGLRELSTQAALR
ncbi:MAG: glycosyltransferase family 2 protein [Acidobacteriota bacterium]|nr:glycosyltransferase family 2 protein [Acidobacteriota bacterium]